MNKTRIATVKATGKRYVVDQLDFRTNTAHVWGEVIEVKSRTLQTRHSDQKKFKLDEVTISEVPRTYDLLQGLFQQNVDALREQGNVITGCGRTLTNHGTPAQVETRKKARECLHTGSPMLDTLLGGSPRRGKRFTYNEPSVTQGPDQPIPETRSEVLEKIVQRLTSQGAHLQRYSNGEFTSSSLAVGLTFEACKNVPVLESPGYIVHFDKALGLYWRRGGSWD